MIANGDRIAEPRLTRNSHRHSDGSPSLFPTPSYMAYVLVPIGDMCKTGEDPSLGEVSSTPGAREEEGRVERRNDGEGPPSGLCRRKREEKVKKKSTGKTRQVETRGQSLQEKEVTLRYRLQMTAITRRRAGEVAGEYEEWVVEKLRHIAATASILLS